MAPTTKRAQRSRAEQRESTRAAIIDTAVASLIEEGPAATTVRGVAERAGLSQGAVQHYYPTRAALLDAAIRHMTDETARSAIEQFPMFDGDERERLAALLDVAFTIAQTPTIRASLDIHTASRTDPDLAATVEHLTEYAETAVLLVARTILGDLVDHPGAQDWMRLNLATVYGALLLSSAPATATLAPSWSAIRDHILASFDTVRAQHNPPSP
ncbi:TetR family transcriptional regulator [Nocardia sp. NPDC051756]|uniref:TetR/AcrR family transcriptional regulator n=1 Tax=Nocardia sp. NPDC051756 TaxID=3154751 RepID=UPI00343E9471